MKHVVRKCYLNYEKEEKWLNEMSSKGLQFVDYTLFRYQFEVGIPGDYIYRIELLGEMPNHPSSVAYIKFMEDMGVECVSTYVRWAYFRRKANMGPFELFTDFESKIKHHLRIVSLLGILAVINGGFGLRHLIFETVQWNIFSIYYLNLGVFLLLLPTVIKNLLRIRKLKKEKRLYGQ